MFELLHTFFHLGGRRSRTSLVLFHLFLYAVFVEAGMQDALYYLFGQNGLIFMTAFGLALSFSAFSQRFRDAGLTGWWSLAMLIPGFGPVFAVYAMVIEPSEGMNQFGPDPRVRKSLRPENEPVLG